MSKAIGVRYCDRCMYKDEKGVEGVCLNCVKLYETDAPTGFTLLAEGPLTQVSVLEKKNKAQKEIIETYKLRMAAGDKGREWLQRNLPGKYVGYDLLNAAAEHIRELQQRITLLEKDQFDLARGYLEEIEDYVKTIRESHGKDDHND